MSPFSDAKYCGTYVSLEELPSEPVPEIAFVGRSNVGKSSAINTLLQRKRLAYVSGTPGCTRWINFYSVPNLNINLVDLPGYGYSAVSKTLKNQWSDLLMNYIMEREFLKGVCVICDLRRGLTDFDKTLLDSLAVRGIFVHILFTKSDKLSRMQANKAFDAIQYDGPTVVTAQLFSSHTRAGCEQAWSILQEWTSS